MFLSPSRRPSDLSLGQKLIQVNWLLVLLLCVAAGVGFAMLYSAAGGDTQPWAARQAARFGVGLVLMLAIAVVDLRVWLRSAYAIYFATLGLLVAVELAGASSMGAQRWIDLGVVQLQPSELMKVAIVLGLARYFHGISIEDIGRPIFLIVPLALIAAPVALILRQPDLGTAILLLLLGAGLFFIAGARIWKFVTLGVIGLAAIPIGWQFLRDYQKDRIATFLNPENDPLGAGYHILQSKIALGSGGLFGRGFLRGPQSHLNFLPEKQTDFIFTMLAEEFGLAGGIGLLALYAALVAYGFAIALRSTSHFGRLLALGIGLNLFLYAFVNIAMVMGLLPVVGVPLPLISYGGTAMFTLMAGFGLLICVYVHRDVDIPRRWRGRG